MIAKIVSGGQTGVDRAGLDAALAVGIPIGGWCPKGRFAEDGTVPERYPLVETGGSSYTSRTEQNVIDSDATLLVNRGKLSGGTRRTVEFCHKHGRPFLVVQVDEANTVETASQWVADLQVRVLNVAGPRESKCPGIYGQALSFLDELFRRG